MGKANVSKSELALIIISNRITIACGQDFFDLGEIVHLTPKKTRNALFFNNFLSKLSLNQMSQLVRDPGVRINYIVQVSINSTS